jgi:TonB family protein
MFTAAVASAKHGDLPFKTGVIFSVLFHLVILAGIPLLVGALRSSVSFERPPTFQLVAAPRFLRPLQPAVQKAKKEPVKPVPREKGRTEEDVEELASVLNEIPAPARVATVGDFKYHWYLAQTQGKIERFWNPPAEDKSDSVVVAFTIFSDGSISAPVVHQKSRNSTLDELALQAVRLAAPFGRLPPGVSGDRYEILCTLRPTRNY